MILEQIKKTVCRHQLLENGDRVLAAVSGGADSVCLLEALLCLAPEMGFSVAAAHLHHGLRGAAADEDEAFVRQLCREKEVPLYVRCVDIAALAKEQGSGLEETGRRERYAFFNETAAREGLNKVATAHHAGDNIETVLMRLIRGTGPRGLAGIPYRNGVVIRPLLDVRRSDIEAFLQSRQLGWQTDDTNFETEFTRNRIRHQLIPMLEQSFNPGFQKTFQEQLALYNAGSVYIEGEVRRLFEKTVQPVSAGYSFSCDALRQESPFLVSMLLHETISALSENREIGMTSVQAAAELLHSGGGRQDLGGGAAAQCCGGRLYLYNKRQIQPFTYEAALQDSLLVTETGHRFSFRRVAARPEIIPKNTAFFSAEKLAGKRLRLRSRRPGDVFYPSGMPGSQKLKDFFINKKIPQFLRDMVPLLTADEDIIWVAGLRADERYIAQAGEKNVLCVQMTEPNNLMGGTTWKI